MGYISYASSDGIGTITIDRPEKKNAMTYAMLSELWDALDEGAADDGARALILTGVPGAFCAGTDLSDLQSTPEDQRGGGGQRRVRGASPLMDCPKPIVCAIDGPAIGMGTEFTSMCDVRIATPRARFGWVFVHRGLVPDTGAGTWILPRLIGVQATARLLYSGEIMSADDMAAMGYLAAVVESEELEAAARREAARFAVRHRRDQGPPLRRSRPLVRGPRQRQPRGHGALLPLRGPQGGRGQLPRASAAPVHRPLNPALCHRRSHRGPATNRPPWLCV